MIMIDFQKELAKYEPVLEIDQLEEMAEEDNKDILELLQYLFAKGKGE